MALATTQPPARSIWALLALLAVAAWLQAGASAQPSAAQRELLNSERIEQRYGSYGVEVLLGDSRLRVSSLFSGTGAERICRTFAVVRYPAAIDPRLAHEHDQIVAGGSIGAVFSARGWRVEKTHLHYGEIGSTARSAALMGGLPPAQLALHVYALDVAKDGVRLPYAILAEVHHPDYLTLEDLQRVYGEPSAAGRAADVADVLALVAEHL